ncbi:MAG: hypothetical protein U1D55_15940 [Phycisphaerae bacterium]
MDAFPPRRIVGCMMLACCGGCTLFQPTQKPTPSKPSGASEPVVVKNAPSSAIDQQPTSAAPDPAERQVQEYIERMSRAGKRAPQSPIRPAGNPDASPVAGDEMADSQRAEMSPIGFGPAASDDSPRVTAANGVESAQAAPIPIVRLDAAAANPREPTAAPTAAATTHQAPATNLNTAAQRPSASPAKAPALLGVNAQAETPRLAASTSASSVSPPPNAPSDPALRTAALDELLKRLTAGSDGSPFRRQLDERLLRAATGDYAAARRPLELVSSEQAELASRYVEAFIAIRDGHGGDSEASARRAAAELDRLSDSLRGTSEITISAVEICGKVSGFGQYTPIQPARFPTGSAIEFALYCELRDFASQAADDGSFVSRFDLRVSVLSRAGEVITQLDNRDLTDRCRTRRHDCFIAPVLRLPATMAPGDYVVKVTAADRIGGSVAERRATFAVTARP